MAGKLRVTPTKVYSTGFARHHKRGSTGGTDARKSRQASGKCSRLRATLEGCLPWMGWRGRWEKTRGVGVPRWRLSRRESRRGSLHCVWLRRAPGGNVISGLRGSHSVTRWQAPTLTFCAGPSPHGSQLPGSASYRRLAPIFAGNDMQHHRPVSTRQTSRSGTCKMPRSNGNEPDQGGREPDQGETSRSRGRTS